MFSQIRKALVPLVVAIVLYLCSLIGVTSTPGLEEQVTLIVVATLVYFIPNEPRG